MPFLSRGSISGMVTESHLHASPASEAGTQTQTTLIKTDWAQVQSIRGVHLCLQSSSAENAATNLRATYPVHLGKYSEGTGKPAENIRVCWLA